MVRKSLHNLVCFNEIIDRIFQLTEDSQKKWGKMNVSQMLCHCNLILQVPLQKIDLPKINIFFETIGWATKIEMQFFNNGIPKNMPTFKKLIVNFECDFNDSRSQLLKTLDEYRLAYENHHLPQKHSLFGNMTEKDWGFLEYKHLNHHLKQFNV
ncbi:Protein of unknown function [Chryseobacterium soldanellicola]|uniref:DUF1569 domain-containing protein n=1 Tax=Chryseobacterium soldanellicola TaxID=311333 RepID=A0A1H1GDV0_9FLAO|nr:DUF1569 domain-containing protein [Chryseobacterium soldanellicola]SDR11279.1 Protein of unknown function [Chryseobacterium soldanellicola]